MDVYGLWKQATVPGENPRLDRKNMQTLLLTKKNNKKSPTNFLLWSNRAHNFATMEPLYNL